MFKKFSNKKKILFLIITGVLLTSVSVFATYLINSNEVEFDSSVNGLVDENDNPVTDVQTAIDVLLDKVENNKGVEYNITLNAQNGESNTTVKSTAGATYGNLEAPATVPSGKIFAGWYDKETGGNRITSDTVITEDNKTIYAHWADSNFGADAWDTILENVRSANGVVSRYNVGDTKEVDLGTYGVHTVRVANNSNYDCTLESKTACGFVVEFTDIITTHRMNPFVSKSTNLGENANGGWEYSEMRSWLNTTLLAAFPEDMQRVMTATKVVSGYESGKSANYVTADKLYLLSTKEIYSVAYTYDKVDVETRQLDYYNGQGLTTDLANIDKAIKKNGNSAKAWWLRSADSGDAFRFLDVGNIGIWNDNYSISTNGVSPAFRIG